MNLVHRKLCASHQWARKVADTLPGWLAGLDLGDDVLEIGPGFGATTRILVELVPKLTSIEIFDPLGSFGVWIASPACCSASCISVTPWSYSTPPPCPNA